MYYLHDNLSLLNILNTLISILIVNCKKQLQATLNSYHMFGILNLLYDITAIFTLVDSILGLKHRQQTIHTICVDFGFDKHNNT